MITVRNAASRQFTLDSSAGLASDLPAPFAKSSAAAMPVRFERSALNPLQDTVSFSYGKLVSGPDSARQKAESDEGRAGRREPRRDARASIEERRMGDRRAFRSSIWISGAMCSPERRGPFPWNSPASICGSAP